MPILFLIPFRELRPDAKILKYAIVEIGIIANNAQEKEIFNENNKRLTKICTHW